MEIGRKVKEVNHETSSHSRENRIVHNTGDRLNDTGYNTQRFAVTDFKVLTHGHCFCFTVTVGTETNQTENKADRSSQ